MSVVGPLQSSLVQAAQQQQVSGKSRSAERAANDRTRRYQDQVDLKVAAVEDAEAVRQIPRKDSEESRYEEEGEAERQAHAAEEEMQHIDIQA